MALESIEPRYKLWIEKLTPDNIYESLLQLKNDFNNIIEDIIYEKVEDKKINPRVKEAQRKLLYLNLARNYMISTDQEIKNKEALDKLLFQLENNIEVINEYENRSNILSQKKAIDLLTLISVIFLPITFITGYFGMNFGSMGNPAEKYGVLSLKYGQVFVFFLFFITIIVTLLIVRRYYNLNV